MAPGLTCPLPGPAWLQIGAPQPVAAALAQAGTWSLDGPVRNFDAETWWYRLAFDAPSPVEAGWLLGLDGLATLADAWLNGEHVLNSTSMYCRHEVPLPALRPLGNELLLRFSPLDEALAQKRPRPRWRVPMLSHQQLRWHRTTLLGRTPGWSPPAAVVGPWQPIWLARRELTAPVDVHLRAHIEGAGLTESGRLTVQGRWAGADPGPCVLRVSRGGLCWQVPLQPQAGAGEGGPGWTAELSIQPMQRWWPHTHGEPALYEVEIALDAAQRPDLQPDQPPWSLGALGFRTLVLDTSDGGLAVQVNGVPVFCRGACWVPLDALRLHASPAAYGEALAQVRGAGMNMLRVPGTMVYEADAFYAACDAAGVLVWQDLMFASMDYPAGDAAFDEQVRRELHQQLPRWQGRPSLAVVCGNSEVSQQAAMWGTAPAEWSPALFHDTLPALVAALLPGVPYWPSSAHGGDFPFQPDRGSTSYYGVGAYRRPVEDTLHSGLRFATECLALAQVPSDQTLQRIPDWPSGSPVNHPAWKARVPRDGGAGWDFDDVRDHYTAQWLGPGTDLPMLRASDPQRYLAVSRVASAELLAESFAQWRRADARCGGALVWTLRDFRAGAGWGLLDDRGHPKAVFHTLGRVLQPCHLAVIDEGLNGVFVHVDNESPEALHGELELVLYQQDEVVTARGRCQLSLAPRTRRRLSLITVLGHFMDVGWAYRFGPPAVSLVVARLHLPEGRQIGPVCRFAPGHGGLRHHDIGLQGEVAAVDPAEPNLRRVRVSSRAAARGVYFESDGWQPDQEFFDLPPGGEAWVTFRPACSNLRIYSRTPTWRVNLNAINSRACVVLPDLTPS